VVHGSSSTHIGSYRRFVVSDMIRRYLEIQRIQGYHVMNIVDLADRSIKGAERSGMTCMNLPSVA